MNALAPSVNSLSLASAAQPRWRRHALLPLLAILLTCFRVPAAEPEKAPAAATPAAGLPPAKEIIARFVREIGGTPAFDKIQSQRMTGQFEMSGQGLKGTVEVLAKRPDKLLMKMTVPGFGELLQGYDGTVGWSMNPATGPMLLEGKMLEQVREQSRFDAALHAESEFKSVETVGKAEFDGKETYQVKLVRKSGQESTEYYDVKTGFLVGSKEVQETPLGPIEVTATVGDYRKFGDVLFATRLTQKMGPLTQVMTFEKMDINGVQDSAFELPAQIRALVKK